MRFVRRVAKARKFLKDRQPVIRSAAGFLRIAAHFLPRPLGRVAGNVGRFLRLANTASRFMEGWRGARKQARGGTKSAASGRSARRPTTARAPAVKPTVLRAPAPPVKQPYSYPLGPLKPFAPAAFPSSPPVRPATPRVAQPPASSLPSKTRPNAASQQRAPAGPKQPGKRVPWQGWRSQLRNEQGRWTGEQYEDGRDAGQSPSGRMGGSSTGSRDSTDQLRESIDALTEQAKIIAEALKRSPDKTPDNPQNPFPSPSDKEPSDWKPGAQPAKNAGEASPDKDIDFARTLGGVLKTVIEVGAGL